MEEDFKKTPTHILAADCPDCGRMVVYMGKCGKCGSQYWLPAGYINRKYLRQLMEQTSAGLE